MKRFVLVAALILSCRSKEAPPAPASAEPPVVTKDSAGLLFTWIDEAGEFHVESTASAVPDAERATVRVMDPSKEAPAETTFVADLRAAGPDGRYAVKAMPSEAFEKIAVDRRAKKGTAVLAARGAAPPPSGSAALETAPAVLIYGAEWCGPCHQLQAYLKRKGVPFVEKDIDKDPTAAAEMRQKLARVGQPAGSIPVVDIKGRILVGFDPGAVDRALASAR